MQNIIISGVLKSSFPFSSLSISPNCHVNTLETGKPNSFNIPFRLLKSEYDLISNLNKGHIQGMIL